LLGSSGGDVAGGLDGGVGWVIGATDGGLDDDGGGEGSIGL
jgi:hypothetical protein